MSSRDRRQLLLDRQHRELDLAVVQTQHDERLVDGAAVDAAHAAADGIAIDDLVDGIVAHHAE